MARKEKKFFFKSAGTKKSDGPDQFKRLQFKNKKKYSRERRILQTLTNLRKQQFPLLTSLGNQRVLTKVNLETSVKALAEPQF